MYYETHEHCDYVGEVSDLLLHLGHSLVSPLSVPSLNLKILLVGLHLHNVQQPLVSFSSSKLVPFDHFATIPLIISFIGTSIEYLRLLILTYYIHGWVI